MWLSFVSYSVMNDVTGAQSLENNKNEEKKEKQGSRGIQLRLP